MDVDLKVAARDLTLLKYTLVATITLLAYEYVITSEEERRLVWPSRSSAIKYIFFLNRYLPFVCAITEVYVYMGNTSNTACKPLLYLADILTVLLFIIGELVLFMRVYAVWYCKTWMYFLLVANYVPGAVVAMYATVHTTKIATSVLVPELFPRGCIVSFPNRQFWICYVVLLFHESLTLFLLLLRLLHFKHYTVSALLTLMIKDGVLYYICVLAMSVANVLVLLLASAEICTLLIVTQGILHSILCSRLLLRLRGAYESLTDTGLRSIRFQTASTLTSTYVTEESIPMSNFSDKTRRA